jgi:hypothetical protein
LAIAALAAMAIQLRARKSRSDASMGRRAKQSHGTNPNCHLSVAVSDKRQKAKSPSRWTGLALWRPYGAGKEARTLDLYLGKVSLDQLSYSRVY